MGEKNTLMGLLYSQLDIQEKCPDALATIRTAPQKDDKPHENKVCNSGIQTSILKMCLSQQARF